MNKLYNNNTKISNLPLDKGVIKSLNKCGINKIEDFKNISIDKLKGIRGLGEIKLKTLIELVNKFADGFQISTEISVNDTINRLRSEGYTVLKDLEIDYKLLSIFHKIKIYTLSQLVVSEHKFINYKPSTLNKINELLCKYNLEFGEEVPDCLRWNHIINNENDKNSVYERIIKNIEVEIKNNSKSIDDLYSKLEVLEVEQGKKLKELETIKEKMKLLKNMSIN